MRWSPSWPRWRRRWWSSSTTKACTGWRGATRGAPRSAASDRRAILKIIFALLGLHIVEIWCFGLAYWGLLHVPNVGFVHGEHGSDNLFDAIYLSATTYTTLGIGDLAPVGAVRLVSGMEALTGFLMITWSASFTYLEMSRLWTDDQRR